MEPTERSRLQRLPERGHHDRATIQAVLDGACLGHIGFVSQQQPVVIPTLYGRAGDRLYLHGSAASRMLVALAGGIPACVTVTIVDGWVLARSAFHHSMNYRSVVAFGRARLLEEPARKVRALKCISEHLLAGRWNDVRGPSRTELAATAVIEFDIEEASAKIRRGPPKDDDEDYKRTTWAGVVPVILQTGTPVPDAQLPEGVPLPDYLRVRINP